MVCKPIICKKENIMDAQLLLCFICLGYHPEGFLDEEGLSV